MTNRMQRCQNCRDDGLSVVGGRLAFCSICVPAATVKEPGNTGAQAPLLDVTVLGIPVAKGRPRFSGNGHAFTPDATRKAEERFANEVATKLFDAGLLVLGGRGRLPLAGPLAAEVVFATKAKVTSRPDLDNLLKLVLDALNGVVWNDDSQVISIKTKKIQDVSNPRTQLRVWAIKE